MEIQGKAILILPDENPEMSKGGIAIPKTAKDKPNEGTVVDYGPGCTLVGIGFRVQYPRKQASIIQIDDKEHHFIIEDQLFFIHDRESK